MRILALGSRSPDALGGAERSLARLILRLARRHKVTLAVPSFDLPCDAGPKDGLVNLELLPAPMEAQQLAQILSKLTAIGNKPDIILTFDKGCFKNPHILKTLHYHLPQVPLVAKESTVGKFRRLLLETLAPERKHLVNQAISRMVCVSQRVREDFERAGLFDGRLVDIPNGVDTDRFRPTTKEEKIRLRRNLGLPTVEVPLFLVAGRFADKKNLDIVFGAWFELERRLGDFGFLVLLGAPHKPYDIPLTRLFTEELKNIRIVPPVQRDEVLVTWYQACDFLLSPTSREGLSNVCLEAMSSGMFPIVSQASGYEDLILGPETGLVIEERNTSQLIKAMEHVIEDTKLFCQRGRTP